MRAAKVRKRACVRVLSSIFMTCSLLFAELKNSLDSMIYMIKVKRNKMVPRGLLVEALMAKVELHEHPERATGMFVNDNKRGCV